jgi:hypothetical protein
MPRLLWNRKFHYHVHKSPIPAPIPSQMKPVNNFPFYFTTIHSNINFPPTPRSSKWSLPFKFLDQGSVYISHLSHACYVSRPFHPPWTFFTVIIINEAYTFWSSSLCSILQSPTTSSLLGHGTKQNLIWTCFKCYHPQQRAERLMGRLFLSFRPLVHARLREPISVNIMRHSCITFGTDTKKLAEVIFVVHLNQ